MQFEYQARLLQTGPEWNDSLNAILSDLGAEGWDLVAIVPPSADDGLPQDVSNLAEYRTRPTWVFKRPKPLPNILER